MLNKKLFLPLLLLTLLLAACAGSSMQEAQLAYDMPSSGAVSAPAQPPMEAADGSEIALNTANTLAFASGEGATGQANQVERLIIRTGNLRLVVTDTEETTADITRLEEQSGGWVVSANLRQYGSDAKSGDITIRVPAAGFVGMMDTLKAMAVEVQSESVSGQDVTEEYVDLAARLGNLEATAVRVRSFLDEATTVEEALAVNQELSRLEGEIEVIKGRMQYLSQSAAFSTITVSLMPDIATRPVQVAGWRPQGVVRDAVEALIGALQGLATLAIWLFIVILPISLLIGIPLWLLVRFVRRRRQQRKIEHMAPVTSGE
ncbi:MAG TPA: DUF4349 domain-containing protein [Chloroflexota bacterium]|nr:DUF4349 domain-containing protein [Chloroflexota bacterium]